MYKDNGTKPHSEDQLRLCYLPEVNTPLRKAGENMQGSLNHPVSFYVDHSVIQQVPSALGL